MRQNYKVTLCSSVVLCFFCDELKWIYFERKQASQIRTKDDLSEGQKNTFAYIKKVSWFEGHGQNRINKILNMCIKTHNNTNACPLRIILLSNLLLLSTLGKMVIIYPKAYWYLKYKRQIQYSQGTNSISLKQIYWTAPHKYITQALKYNQSAISTSEREKEREMWHKLTVEHSFKITFWSFLFMRLNITNNRRCLLSRFWNISECDWCL